jgi:hypothetical protein
MIRPQPPRPTDRTEKLEDYYWLSLRDGSIRRPITENLAAPPLLLTDSTLPAVQTWLALSTRVDSPRRESIPNSNAVAANGRRASQRRIVTAGRRPNARRQSDGGREFFSEMATGDAVGEQLTDLPIQSQAEPTNPRKDPPALPERHGGRSPQCPDPTLEHGPCPPFPLFRLCRM